MKRLYWPKAAAALAACLLLLSCQGMRADVVASADLSFSGLSITPSSGTLVFLADWGASAYAQAGPGTAFDSGGGQRAVNAAGDYSLGHGDATILTPQGLSVTAHGSSSVNIPGSVDASDFGTG